MIPRERLETVLEGGRADRLPIAPIYDMGYVMRCTGRDQREWVTATEAEHRAFVEESFLRHEVDGFFTHQGRTDDWANENDVEKCDGYWMVTTKATGEKFRLLPGCSWAQEDGSPVPQAPSSGGVSRIQTAEDIDRFVDAAPTESEMRDGPRFRLLRYLAAKYPDHHFSFQVDSVMSRGITACGGYVEGLLTMAGDRDLFGEILAREAERQIARLRPGKEAGGRSIWFTSFYQGADTISPADYAELVFPHERRICQAAKDAGLYVLNWYLGDLMPTLDQVMELPMDALVLEQGRKGYVTDPVAIRERVGPKFCLFGFGFENDYCTDDRDGLTRELERQVRGAGMDGAFVVGTPIMPPNARPEAVDHYFAEARRLSAEIPN